MEQVSKYFTAEKNESMLFIFVGMIAILLSVYFFIKLHQPFFIGIAYPLIAIALIQIAVGSSIYFRSPKDIIRVNEILQTDKSKIQTEEIPRMKTVMKNFTIYKWVEISLILIGILMLMYFQPMTMWKGIGLGLAVQAAFMLALDLFAASRGKVYLAFLQRVLQESI